jgi:pyridoxamine 5'-phosphate oxidase
MSNELRDKLRGLRVFDEDLPDFAAEATPDEPAPLLLGWIEHAIESGVRAPHAMTLATVDEYGRPNARVLLLKGVEDGRIEFATSRDSRKGRELAFTRSAAVTFHWPEIGRQVRARGRVTEADGDAARRDFLARPEPSRAESLHGKQSQRLDDRAELDAAFEEGLRRVGDDPELVPEHWTVYQLVPVEIEFWQGRPDRRHVRLRYRQLREGWARELLWP